MTDHNKPHASTVGDASRWICGDDLEGLGYLRIHLSDLGDALEQLENGVTERAADARLCIGHRCHTSFPGDGLSGNVLIGDYKRVRQEVDEILDGRSGGSYVFLVVSDAHWPASLALLCVSLLCLLGEKSMVDKVRVLVAGQGALPIQLKKLWVAYETWACFETVPPKAPFDAIQWRSVLVEELGEALAEDLVAEGACPAILGLCPKTAEMAAAIQSRIETVEGLSSWDVVDLPSCPPDAQWLSIEIWDSLVSWKKPRKLNMVSGNWNYFDGISGAISSLHIIVDDSRARTMFDISTSQVVEGMGWLSMEEREEILSLALKAEAAMTNVFVYHCSQHRCASWSEYVRAGPAVTRTDVANDQLLGFLAGVAWYEGYHKSTLAAIEAFVSDGPLAKEAIRQLDLQGIVNLNGTGQGLARVMEWDT